MEISEQELSHKDTANLILLESASTAFGRMGRIAERILSIFDKITITPEQRSELYTTAAHILGESIHEIMQLTITGFRKRAANVSQTILYYREEITELSASVKRRYILKIHEGGRDDVNSTLYTDIFYEQEQLIDYCDMIADALIRYNKEIGAGKQPIEFSDERIRNQVHELFRDKYEVLKKIVKTDDD
jgi:phosphate:Na+ symporter